jgi:hypothetical protein
MSSDVRLPTLRSSSDSACIGIGVHGSSFILQQVDIEVGGLEELKEVKKRMGPSKLVYDLASLLRIRLLGFLLTRFLFWFLL